ncbi:MAG: T9SS type A sorting domain-containing protein [Ferruginibacter sp.]
MKKTALFVLAVFWGITMAVAQCPVTITGSVVTTGASCPSNGSASINTNISGGSGQNYTLISGPAGVPLNTPQASNLFSALLPGAYTVRVACAGTQQNFSFNIADNYPRITDVNASITNNSCTNGLSGGTVLVSSITGGRPPYQYSLIQSTDPNYADNLSAYGPSTTLTGSSNATYQLRVKDACNQYFTKTLQFASYMPPVHIDPWLAFNDQACGNNATSIYYSIFNSATSNYTDLTPYIAAGISVTMWQAPTGFDCDGSNLAVLPSGCGSPVYQNTVTTDTMIIPIVPGYNYIIKTETACGQWAMRCLDLSWYLEPRYEVNAQSSGCGGNAGGERMIIRQTSAEFIKYPAIVTVRNSSNVIVDTKTLNSVNDVYESPLLPLGTYTVQLVDACGNTVNNTVYSPASNTDPVNLNPSYYTLYACAAGSATQAGTTQAHLELEGYVPNITNSTITITSGPSNVGVAGVNYPLGTSNYIWTNMLPGNYTASIASPTITCGTRMLNFTIDNSLLLQQSVSATSTSFCSGGGSVTAVGNYNGPFEISYTLCNAVNNGEISTNSTGEFSNLPAGSYYVKMVMSDYCSGVPFSTNSNTVSIIAGSGPPDISKKVGVNCETAAGVSTGTASIFLELAGAAPLLLEYKPISSSSYTVYSNNAPANVTIAGLLPNTIYDIRLTSCGKTYSTQVAVGQLQNFSTLTSVSPCNGAAYTLQAPIFTGAVYSWKNPAGNIVSTTDNYHIASYNSSYNGVYNARISFGTCVSRDFNIGISSVNCGQLLPIKLASFTASKLNCSNIIKWTMENEVLAAGFELQKSFDGANYTTISRFAGNGSSYEYRDAQPGNGKNYYRLKIIGKDGNITYSNILPVYNDCSNATQVMVYPNPSAQFVIIESSSLSTASFELMDISGRKLKIPVLQLSAGKYRINVSVMPNGNYLLKEINTGTTYKIVVQH